MLRLFRNIRQRLLTENKFNKYLLYAIGEIILVVIGILIALSINNRNDNARTKFTERELLIEMQANLRRDLIDLTYNIARNKVILKANRTVLNYLDDPSIHQDSLDYFFANIQGNTVFGKNTSAYENIKSIGLRSTKNEILREKITNLYSDAYDYLRYMEQNRDDKFQYEQLIPQITKKLILDSIEYSAHPVDISALSQDQEFKEILKINCAIRDRMIVTYATVETEIYDLIDEIEREVQQ